MRLYAFDDDDTLEISNGPVRLGDMQALRSCATLSVFAGIGAFSRAASAAREGGFRFIREAKVATGMR